MIVTTFAMVSLQLVCSRLGVCRRSAGVLGRSGAHGDNLPISVGDPEMLQQTGQPREEGGEQRSYSTQD